MDFSIGVPAEADFSNGKITFGLDNDKLYYDYFHGNPTYYESSEGQVDIFKLASTFMGQIPATFALHYGILGCIMQVLTITMQPNKTFELDLSNTIGDGELLYISYTPITNHNGDTIFPMELHSNIPQKHINNKQLRLFPYCNGSNPCETEVQVSLWYAPKNLVDDLPSMLMIDAFRHFYEKNYRYMIISAQTSVEILQSLFFEQSINTLNTKKEDLNDFIKDKSTFYSQLFVLLPWFSNVNGCPLPNSIIMQNMRRLVSSRNGLVHAGKIKSEWSHPDYLNMLVSAFFMYKYYKVIHGIKYN